MHHLFRIIIITLCAALGHTGSAAADSRQASIEVVRTDVARGTSNNCSLRDHYGFLWVGTSTGLCCFDGNGKPVYRNQSGVLESTGNIPVTALFEFGDNIWFGSNCGLHIFDRRANSASRLPVTTTYGVQVSSRVSCIMCPVDDRIWITTLGQGLFIFNPADSTLSQDSRHGSFYSDMVKGPDGLIYLATINGDIQAFSTEGRLVSTSLIPDFHSTRTSAHMASAGKSIYITYGTSLYRLDTATGDISKTASEPVLGAINDIITLPDNSLLLATEQGVWGYDPVAGSIVKVLKGAASDTRHYPIISDLAYDTDRNILVTGANGGVDLVLTSAQASQFVGLDGLPDPGATVNDICATADRLQLWVGSGCGLALYDPSTGSFTNIDLPVPGSDAVLSLCTDGTRLWIGTQHNGLLRYDTATGAFRSYRYDASVPYTVVSNRINDIYRSATGEIFILTDWGPCRYVESTDNFRQIPEIGMQVEVTNMQDDRNGRLWVATAANGLMCRQRPGEQFLTVDAGQLSDYPVTSMFTDSHGTLWAATKNDGIYYLDRHDETFTHLSLPMLRKQQITLMQEDDDGRMWFGSGSIAVCVDRFKPVGLFSLSHRIDVVPVMGASAITASGNSVVGCAGGFIVFNPKMMKNNSDRVNIYPVMVTFPDSDEGSSAMPELTYMVDKVEIPYNRRSFTIHLAASRPVDMPPVRYEYNMRGLPGGWVLGATLSEVTYNQLPPGHYTFEMRPAGLLDAPVRSLDVTVLPPWYRTGWAYTAYALILAAVLLTIFIVSRKRVRSHYNRRISLMQIEKERETFESKTRFFVNLVHEIRTPLMLISLPLEQLTDELRDKKMLDGTIGRYAGSMQHNLTYLLGITNQLLDFRKAENNSEIRLFKTRCNISEMLRIIAERFRQPLAAGGKEISLEMPGGDVYVEADADKLDRILMNLVGNAMKYSRRQIVVTLNLTADSCVRINVEDDGPGIPSAEREKVFDTYYQIDNGDFQTSLGTGLGLAYARLIAKAHHGSTTVGDSSLGGARLTLTLPLGEQSDDSRPNADAAVTHGDMQPQAPTPEHTDRPTTILVVEDNPELRGMISLALAKSYKVLTAANGAEAMSMLTNYDIDIVVSDVMMPVMDGLELCRRVKSDINTSHIPFIILTARTGKEAQGLGMDCGADVYLEKPFPMRQLERQVANILNTRQLFYKHMMESIITPEQAATDNVEHDNPPGELTDALNKYDAEFISRLNDVITRHLDDEQFSIDFLAESLNMSRSSFYRKLTAVAGIAPGDYLKNFRLNMAVKMLRDGARINEVAAKTGFTSSSYFSKCFREKFGMLPSEFMASVKGGPGQAADPPK